MTTTGDGKRCGLMPRWRGTYPFIFYILRDYAKGFWGQTLRNDPLTKDLKLMVLDHNRDMVKDYTDTVFPFLLDKVLDFW